MGLIDLIGEIIKAKQEKKDGSITIKNYISGNNNQNGISGKNKENNRGQQLEHEEKSNKNYIQNDALIIESIRLYCTGTKGRVYTKEFYKSMNSDFGVEIKIKNNTFKPQKIKIGHCIYDESGDHTMFLKTLYINVDSNSFFTERIKVKQKDFFKIKPGKYKSQVWINDKKMQRVYFVIKNK